MKSLQILALSFLLIRCISDQEQKNISGNTVSPNDTFSLSAYEYDSIRKCLLADTLFISIFFDNIPPNDTNAVKIKKLLNTTYKDRIDSTGLTPGAIDSIFYALRISKGIMDKFELLDKSLDSLNRSTIDSSEKLIEKIQKTVEQKP